MIATEKGTLTVFLYFFLLLKQRTLDYPLWIINPQGGGIRVSLKLRNSDWRIINDKDLYCFFFFFFMGQVDTYFLKQKKTATEKPHFVNTF